MKTLESYFLVHRLMNNQNKKLLSLSNDIPVMNKRISSFIEDLRDNNSSYFTHISQIDPRGKFRIERDSDDQFFEIYQDELFNDPDKFVAGIGECPKDIAPIRDDSDIKIIMSEHKHIDKTKYLYTEDDITTKIGTYQKVIREISENVKNYQLICFLLEKPAPYSIGDDLKSGFHLHFPFAFIDKYNANIHLYPRVLERLAGIKLGTGLGTLDKITDKSVTSKCWLLYGGMKSVKSGSYRLTKIYNADLRQITLKEALRHYKLYDSEEEEIPYTKPLEYYLPRILSIRQRQPALTIKQNLEIIGRKKLPKKENNNKIYNDDLTINELYKKCTELMDMISVKRVNDYDSWMSLGWTLYSIGEGAVEFMDLWINKSRQTTIPNNFSEIRCIYEWERMHKGNYTIGTLKYLAEQDSPQQYAEYKLANMKKRLKSAIEGGHNDLAKILYDMYGNRFVCASMKKDGLWYMFDNHKWNESEEGIDLRTKISSELVQKYKPLANDLNTRMNSIVFDVENEDEDTKNEQKNLEQQLKCLRKLASNLKSHPFKNNIMKECREVFFKKEFVKKLNTNPYLIGFTNGIYDLKEMKHRPGNPDDCISMDTGYDYKEFNEDDEEVLALNDFLEKIFPNPELRQYFLEYCAMLLKGGNVNKIFLILSGVGHNGKSVAIELLEHTLGKYMIKFPTSMVTGKRTQSSQASPELMRSAGVRFAVVQEPGGKDRLNVGVIKELTGNDSVYGRGLYKDGEELKPMFNFAMICNNLPAMPSDEQAGWDRIRVLLFESRFLEANKCPETIEEQRKKKIFPRDTELSEKLPGMKQVFMWKLIQERKRILRNGRMPEPELVRQATDNYKNRNNVFLQFINDMLIKDDNEAMTVMKIYTIFREWFRNNLPGQQVPTKSDMEDDLILRWGKPIANKWKGWRVRTTKDDEREGKILIIDVENKEQHEEKEERKEKKKELPKRVAEKVLPTPPKRKIRNTKLFNSKSGEESNEDSEKEDFDINDLN